MDQKFSEFSECDKSLKHELGSIQRSSLPTVFCWHRGSILASYKRDGSFFNIVFLSLNSANSFSKNLIVMLSGEIRMTKLHVLFISLVRRPQTDGLNSIQQTFELYHNSALFCQIDPGL